MRRIRAAPFAATLSFILPGLGQLALGRPRRAALLALPIVATALTAIALIAPDPTAALDLALRPEAVPVLLAIDGLLLIVHAWAIVDAERLARATRPLVGSARLVFTGLLAVLLVATVALHGAVAVVGSEAGDTLGSVFEPGGPGGDFEIPEPSFGLDEQPSPEATEEATVPTPGASESADASTAGGGTPSATADGASPSATSTVAPRADGGLPTASPSASPSPTPTPKPTATPAWASDGRLNLLLIGSDAGPDRWSLRTDTIIVLSVELKTGRAALFGIPRNLIGVPLPPESAGAVPGGRFPGLLNALYVYAMGHPDKFPGGDARGMRAVSGAIQELVGVRLDAMVVVNLAGFVQLVDELGGLWIDVPELLVDNNYPLEDGSGLIRLRIGPGCQRLSGRMALAYARSRHQDSDYGRMRRQQTVLLALRRQVDPVGLIPKAPALLKVAKDSLWTTIKRTDVRGLAQLAAKVDPRRVARVLFVPSRYPERLDTNEIRQIRQRVRTIFDGPPPAPDPDLAKGHCP
jgi:polyisoprenyl-teichoic acid--peptidoglycan teichoic acid transferase